jgi:hypothetical protein
MLWCLNSVCIFVLNLKKQNNIKKSHLRKLKLSIDIDSVNIYVELGSRVDPIHIAYWVIDEWEEDAEVAISIFRAIELFYIDKRIIKNIGYCFGKYSPYICNEFKKQSK